MILYNMRYRGPMEYDKFVLNTFQFHNEVDDVLMREFNSNTSDSLSKIMERLDDAYSYYVGRKRTETQSSRVGLSEQLYLNLLEYREV